MNLSAERHLEASQLEQDERAFLDEHSIEIGAQSATPSSVLLAPIQERVTSRRTRKKRVPTQPQPSGFPQPLQSEKAPSIFRRTYVREKPPVESMAEKQSATDADAQFEAMTEDEKAEALQEIYSRLSPEMIEFMKNRSKTRNKGSRSITNAQLGATERVDDIMNVDMDIRPHVDENHPENMDVSVSDIDALSANVQNLQLKSNHEVEALKETSYLVNEGLPKEKEKLEWMRDISNEVEAQKEMEEALRICVEKLGEIGRRRFDLNGNMLTLEQVHNLPTHLGLHHHGSNPAEAGYTLTEILLLTRSTVPTQRAMAYSTFSRILNTHRDLVAEPLLKSATLPLTFANFEDYNAPNPAAAIAELSAAESVLKDCHDVGLRELSRDVYFASLFYSPCAIRNANPMVKSLQISDLVPSLIKYAHMWFRNKQFDLSIRALYVARLVVKSCDVNSGKQLVSRTNPTQLYEMANGNANITTLVTSLACDILAFYLLFAGWGEMKGSNADSLHLDKNLKSIGGCIQFYLRLPVNISDEVHLASAASLRVWRAALTFDIGVDIFRERLSAICAVSFSYEQQQMDRNVSPSSIAATEALLALESYIHALYSIASREDSKTEASSDSKEASDIMSNRQKNEALHAQIIALVPLARSAVHLFVDGGFTSLQVAAGHFAGSVFSLHREPMPSDLIPGVLQVAKHASETALEHTFGAGATSASTINFEQVVSSAHAAGRILTKCIVPESLVGQICRNLVASTEMESECRLDQGQRFIRPAANATAEWLVKFAQLRPNREAVFRAVQLLPCVAEPQVIVELVFKCIVNPPLLEVLNSRVARSIGQHAVDKLTPPTLAKLVREQCSDPNREHLKGQATLATFADIVQWWLCAPDTVEDGALVATTLLKADLLSPGGIYRALLYASPWAFVNGSMLSELALASGEKLFRDKNLAFHPNWNTCVSIYSSEKRPPLAENFYQLARRLVERGPFVCEDGKSNEDALASLILTTMCRRDAHVSLRKHLWQETVCDCGGGALFSCAQFLGGVGSIEHEDDEDQMLASYSQALMDGLLGWERCPPVLQQIICARFCARLQHGKSLHPLEILVSGEPRRCLEAKETLIRWSNKWRDERDVCLVSDFFSKPSTLPSV